MPDIPLPPELYVKIVKWSHPTTARKIRRLNKCLLSLITAKVLVWAEARWRWARDTHYCFNWAVKNGHANVVGALLDTTAFLRIFIDSALYKASEEGHLDLVRLLLARGAKVERSYFALRNAAIGGHAEVVKVLLAAGSDPEKPPNSFLDPPLACAVNQGHKDVVEILLEVITHPTAPVHGPALLRAVENGDRPMFAMLLTAGVTGGPDDLDEALWEAASHGYLDMVRTLLNAGADIDSHSGRAIVLASVSGHADVVQALLDAGADMEYGDPEDYPLIWAAKNGQGHVVQLLLESGAHVDWDDCISLLEAAINGHADVVKVLLDAMENLHFDNDHGQWREREIKSLRDANNIALAMGAAGGHKNVVQMMLEIGADVHDDSDWALAEAAKYGHEDVLQMLLAAGADVHGDDDRALREAAANGHMSVLHILLGAGADVHARGDEALSRAVSGRHVEAIESLLAAGATWRLAHI
ncbi:hypothetical protein HK104_001851 [Borealophlyctis nickersoniae]|nr:hypothetical protein HK104_001851 [Borealophlyctis nickersoniae]